MIAIEKGSPATKFSATRASAHLDLLRGLAAVLVLFGHFRHILYVHYPDVQVPYRKLLYVPYLAANFGHQSVVIFFVLSGYLVGGSVLRSTTRGTWKWNTYLVHRVVRLGIVLIPGLALCWMCDDIGLRSGLAPALYQGRTGTYTIFGDVAARHTIRVAIENALFLQTLHGIPVLGSDGALWSLANEFWYYILFPLGLVAVLPNRSLARRFVSGVIFVAVCSFCGYELLPLFPVWCLGAALFYLPLVRMSRTVRWIGAALFFIFFVAMEYPARRFPGEILLQDYILGFATALLLIVILSAREPRRSTLTERFGVKLASFSFTLYIIHTPLCVLLTAALAGDTRWQPTLPHLALGLVSFLGILGIAYAVAYFTEFRTERVRHWIESRLPSRAV